jgi:hypothetical protein
MSTAVSRPAGVPFGYCWCGCGLKAPIATKTDLHKGLVKGKPKHYINSHQNRRRDLRTEFYLKRQERPDHPARAWTVRDLDRLPGQGRVRPRSASTTVTGRPTTSPSNSRATTSSRPHSARSRSATFVTTPRASASAT